MRKWLGGLEKKMLKIGAAEGGFVRWRAHKVDVGGVWVVLRALLRDERRRDIMVAAWVWEQK